MVKHYKMKSGDHERMADLARGKYVFSVFAGDDETATGNFEIR
jgi:dihydrodipicolinate synthase/N-acetylneuraminate lyase